MDPDEETKRMLLAAQPVPMSDVEMNERSSTLRSSQDDDHAEKASKKEAKPKSAYSTDDFWIALRSVYALVMLGASAWIVDQGTKPTTNWIALPWAAYCIVCAIIHTLLFFTPALRAPGSTAKTTPSSSKLSRHTYLATACASIVLLALAVGGGGAVMHLTQSHMGERDSTAGLTDTCGTRRRRRKCYPLTPEGKVFDASCVALAFASLSLLCTLRQCHIMYKVRRNRAHYLMEEEDRLRSNATFSERFTATMKRRVGWWKQG